jgi:poly-gamma-glutamate synthesis protein (capsule biosynthesis protein)
MRALVALLALALLPGSCEGDDAKPVTLAFGGDVMLARQVTRALGEKGPRHVWGDVLPLLRGADLALVNLECCIAESGAPFMPRRVFYFRAAPVAVDALTAAGIDYVSLANNHAMDYEAPALLETIRRLDAAGIAHAGAGANRAAAARPALLEAGGMRVGVVSCADHFRAYGATEREPGTHLVRISTEKEHFAPVRRALKAARAAGAGFVVFSVHWGPNMRQVPTEQFREYARAVIDAGADVFHGHSAHVFQGIEVHHGKPILYDTGDLLDDYRVDERKRNDLQLLFLLKVKDGRVRRIELVPLKIAHKQVNVARGADRAEVHRRMRRLCADMGTKLRVWRERLVVDLP